MAIVFKLLPDGGFVVGDTETRHCGYTYPTSTYARMARYLPERVAAEMIRSVNRFAAPANPEESLAEYDGRMWTLLEGVLR